MSMPQHIYLHTITCHQPTTNTLRVYQAYNNTIADAALMAQKFTAPFNRNRMTWIKPNILWMMYRSGWNSKSNQERTLGIDITRDAFFGLLRMSCSANHKDAGSISYEIWKEQLAKKPVRVQWDPGRSLLMIKNHSRVIQVGVGPSAIDFYNSSIVSITDLTDHCKRAKMLIDLGQGSEAMKILPAEQPLIISA